MMNLLSDVGGLFNSLFVGGQIMVSMFVEKLFFSHIMKEIYQVDNNKKKKGQDRARVAPLTVVKSLESYNDERNEF
jgi:hypothetical protein